MVCPGVDKLEQYLTSELDDDSTAVIREHLGCCAQCSSVLGEVRENLRMESSVQAALRRTPLEPLECPRSDDMDGYRIIRELGRGGIGVVYEAEQDNPRRRVALKLLNARYAADRRYERLLKRETHALARVTHASIAAVYDAGNTRDGRAYFAMELVEGRSIVAFANEHGLSLEERVRLFQRVCAAIAFAHQRGVIHRDLKPSNILVGADGIPKVLDFGLAKLLTIDEVDPPSIFESAVAELGRIAGTVPYMSPEQIQGRTDEIDVRSDVYALGVVLYELLTGALPYSIEPWNLPQAARTICEEAPMPPRRHAPTLSRDLETIVLKALEKDGARRYQFATDLSEDLRRYLRDEPVLARPASTWYQLRKFTRRHRALVASGAVSFVALVAGTAVATGQAYIAVRERDVARRRLAYAQQASNYVFAGVGSQITYILGSGDIQRHLTEAAYKFYRQLADEEPDDLNAQAKLFSAIRRLASQSIDVGNLERAEVLSATLLDLIEQAADRFPGDEIVLRESMYARTTAATVARAAGDTAAMADHARAALEFGQRLAARYEPEINTWTSAGWDIPQEGPTAGTAPRPMVGLRDWAYLTATQLADMLVETESDTAEEYYLKAQDMLHRLMDVDPTLEPIYHSDLSQHAPLAPPILLRYGSRIHYDRALARIQMGLARVAQVCGHPDVALEHLDKALEMTSQFADDTADDPATIDLIASIHQSYARLFQQTGDASRARRHAEQAHGGHQRLALADPRHVVWQRAVEEDEALMLRE